MIDRLRAAVAQSLQDSKLRANFETLGIEPATVEEGGEALRKRVTEELANWTKVIKAAGIKVE